MSVSNLPNWNISPAVTLLSHAAAPLSAYNTVGVQPQTPQDRWIIQQALNCLGQIKNLPGDENYLYHFVGINPVFRNGAEALQVLQGRNIRTEFGDMGDSPAHAQWIADQNLIMINQRYRGDASLDTIRAIAEAIYHEAGHAKDGDDRSSIQEESDCLTLNTMAHRFHEAQDPNYALSSSQSRLMADGVALYPRLFFDADPLRQALINRILLKYGDLPLTSPNHALPALMPGQKPIAQAVAEQKNGEISPRSLSSFPDSQISAKTVTGAFLNMPGNAAAVAPLPASALETGQQLSVVG